MTPQPTGDGQAEPSCAFVSHPGSLQHESGPGHPERAERIQAITAYLDACGLKDRMHDHEPGVASRDLVELAHEPTHFDLLEDLDSRGGGRIDLDTSMGPSSLDAALRATQGCVDAVRHVLDGSWSSAFVCMRPPGHHARPRVPMGFCLTNHVAIAALWAIEEGRAARVAIIDWDAHHGNGTQEIFWTDPDVLYVSLHQYPWYPGSGDATERGEGAGAGYTLNVPLPAGGAEDAYHLALETVIEPAVTEFEPDVVLVSAGFDAHHLDPLCMMRLSAGAFYRFAKRVSGWGPGPVCVLEGGYDLDALAWSAAGTISALLGDEDPAGVPPSERTATSGPPEALRWVERASRIHAG